MNVTRVLLITRQRSGSTFFLALLAQHPESKPGQLLNFTMPTAWRRWRAAT